MFSMLEKKAERMTELTKNLWLFIEETKELVNYMKGTSTEERYMFDVIDFREYFTPLLMAVRKIRCSLKGKSLMETGQMMGANNTDTLLVLMTELNDFRLAGGFDVINLIQFIRLSDTQRAREGLKKVWSNRYETKENPKKRDHMEVILEEEKDTKWMDFEDNYVIEIVEEMLQ
jgi:hypothetical protein